MRPRACWTLTAAVLLAVVTVAMGSIATAWACVPMAKLISVQPGSSGPPASRVVVNGLGFEQSPVEIRWNAPDGPRLGAAQGPNFSIKVTIPKVPDGLYTLIAVERQENGSIGNTGSAPFDVSTRRKAGAVAVPGGGAGPRTESLPSSSQRSSGPSWLALVAGGAALVLLGALGAVLITRLLSHRTS